MEFKKERLFTTSRNQSIFQIPCYIRYLGTNMQGRRGSEELCNASMLDVEKNLESDATSLTTFAFTLKRSLSNVLSITALKASPKVLIYRNM